MKFGPVAVAAAAGAILAHSLRLPGRVLKKGRVLNDADVADLAGAGIAEAVVARLESGDVGENDAADQVAQAIAGPGLVVTAPFAGRCNLVAEADGVLDLDAAAVAGLNQVNEGMTLATLAPGALVRARQLVATVKVIPFAVTAEVARACADFGELARVAALKPHRVGLIQTRLPGMRETVLDKTVAVTAARLTALGCDLHDDVRCAHDITSLAGEIEALQDCDLILISGASAIVDRRDVVPAALVAAGGTVSHFGMPVDPGNLMLVGELAGRPVLGLPGCARSPKLNGLDWVLWRLIAGLPVDGPVLMGMGVGGLLKEFAARPQPRQVADAEGSSMPNVTAVVLAAGQSRRMGADNKLLADVNGMPMVRHAVTAALASQASGVLVVTGHDAAAVRGALSGLEVTFTDNPYYAAGLSSSLAAGIAALADDVDGALIMLGDMPLVSPAQINQLIAAFDPAEGRAICIPTWRGTRGNPVLWSRQFFAEMASIEGDVGAKHLVGENDDAVAEVAMDTDGPVFDVDSPEVLDVLRKR